ncbi:MAG: Holliday junction branch migration protein RuvA [Christensenellales bacterium]|jgi:Holliday junction DNA helicase RuvA
MIASVTGKLLEKGLDYVVLEAGGVGFYLAVPTSVAAACPKKGETHRLFTHFYVREDAMVLYGFESDEQKRMFQKLIAVSGVGPKVAMAVLSTLTVTDLAVALVTQDVSVLTRVPGVGKKMAERMILELREKVDNDATIFSGTGAAAAPAEGAVAEAVQGLIALGYQHSEAVRAIDGIKDKSERTEDLILLALRRMGV